MTKNETLRLAGIARRLGMNLEDVMALGRASANLSRWYAGECGDSNEYCSWAIERDPETDRPHRVVYPHTSNEIRRYPIRDMEKVHRAKLAKICAAYGLYHHIQADPRGPAVYVHTQPMDMNNYTDGVSI